MSRSPSSPGAQGCVAAIILAAGQGTRFTAGPKMLAALHGRPMLAHVAAAALASRASPVLAVLGHEAERVSEALGGPAIRLIHNPDYAEGLATSLKAGFAALPPDARAAIILLGDMPLVSGALIDGLIATWDAEGGRPAAIVPVRGGRRGNPVLLSRGLASEVKALSGDAGAGALLRRREDVVEWPVEDDAVLQDFDTAAALREHDPEKREPVFR